MQQAGFSSFLAETYGNSRSAALFRFLFGQNAPKAVGVGMLRSRFSADPNKGKCWDLQAACLASPPLRIIACARCRMRALDS